MITIKTIGVILRTFSENNKIFIGTRKDVFNTLKKFNVNFIGIPINNTFNNILKSISLCDGIILPGGETYTQNDFLLIKYLYQNNIPTLGICLGMQLMAKCFGSQEQNLSKHYSSRKYVHYITITEDSLLFKILKKPKIKVNSRHHSYIPKTNLKVNALCHNIIEGVEAPNKKFFLGVEWHPESLNDSNSYKLFKYFINIL